MSLEKGLVNGDFYILPDFSVDSFLSRVVEITSTDAFVFKS